MNEIINRIQEMDTYKKRQFVILGNGPSIRNYLKYKETIDACVIGFNRVDRFLIDNNLTLDIYICVSDNV